MIGRRFGQLVVIERVPAIDRYARFRCICDCGPTTEVRGSHLSAGHVKSCGCGRQRCAETGAATAIDMVGRVIGRLTVLERAGSEQLYGDMSAALWRCRCRCGNEVVLPGERLRRRNGPRSCGCLRRELGLAKLERARAARIAIREHVGELLRGGAKKGRHK
jgi:hypothetical protein